MTTMWNFIRRSTQSIPAYTSIPDKAIPSVAIPDVTIIDTITNWTRRDY